MADNHKWGLFSKVGGTMASASRAKTPASSTKGPRSNKTSALDLRYPTSTIEQESEILRNGYSTPSRWQGNYDVQYFTCCPGCPGRFRFFLFIRSHLPLQNGRRTISSFILSPFSITTDNLSFFLSSLRIYRETRQSTASRHYYHCNRLCLVSYLIPLHPK